MEPQNLPNIATELREIALKVQATRIEEFYDKVIGEVDCDCRRVAERGEFTYCYEIEYHLPRELIKEICEHVKAKLVARGYGVHISHYWNSSSRDSNIRIHCSW